jgi:ribosomal protein S21
VSKLSADVTIQEGESQESLLRRFQRAMQASGVLRELRERSHFIPKSEAARIRVKANARRKRRARNNE